MMLSESVIARDGRVDWALLRSRSSTFQRSYRRLGTIDPIAGSIYVAMILVYDTQYTNTNS